MKAFMNPASFCIFSIFMLLCISSINGGCLTDSDTSHTTAEYNQRLFTYASRQPVQPSTSSELKFMTFNLQSGFHFNCVNDVTSQATLMRPMDYVGTQETVQGIDTRCNRCNIPQIIADVAGMSTRFVMAMPYRTGQYGDNIGTSQTILDTKYMVMTYTGVEPRVVGAVKTQPLALKGRYLWYVNVHIEFYVPAARVYQMAQIMSFIQDNIIGPDPQAVVVMGGDFNGGPWDSVYTTLKQASYKNVWETFSGSIENGNTIPADWPTSRFDHLWFRAPAGVTITVKSAEVPNVLLSDHRPFTATLAFSVPSSGSVVCVGPIFENVPVTITCPVGTQRMTSVQFASYGNPTGTCQAYKLGTCIGGSSVAVVVDKCLNRNTCTFPVSNNVFGDPCPHTGKHFYAQVLCT